MNDSDQAMTKAPAHGNRLIPYKWEMLALLWVAFCFNQADRQVYNNLLPQIQGDLQLSNEQAGLVASGLYGLFRGVYDSNLFAAPFDVTAPRYSASRKTSPRLSCFCA